MGHEPLITVTLLLRPALYSDPNKSLLSHVKNPFKITNPFVRTNFAARSVSGLMEQLSKLSIKSRIGPVLTRVPYWTGKLF